jgi:hypothetical protein
MSVNFLIIQQGDLSCEGEHFHHVGLLWEGEPPGETIYLFHNIYNEIIFFSLFT